MTNTRALALILVGVLTVVAGVALWSIPAAVILAGLTLVGAGVLFYDLAPGTREERT